MLFSYELTAEDHDRTAAFSSCKLCLGCAMQVVLELLHIVFSGTRQSTHSKGQPPRAGSGL